LGPLDAASPPKGGGWTPRPIKNDSPWTPATVAYMFARKRKARTYKKPYREWGREHKAEQYA